MKDERSLGIFKKILAVHEDIRYDTLKYFVDKCVKLHAIAFLQWRLTLPDKSEESKDIIRELILHRIVELYNLNSTCDKEDHNHAKPKKDDHNKKPKTEEQLQKEKKKQEFNEIVKGLRVLFT